MFSLRNGIMFYMKKKKGWYVVSTVLSTIIVVNIISVHIIIIDSGATVHKDKK